MSKTASLPAPLSEKSVTPNAACPPTAASKALPPASRMRRAASVASAFMDATAAWRPRITGRMVWPESLSCGRAGGTEARRRKETTSDITAEAEDDSHDIGFCHLEKVIDLWNPTFRKERERWGTRVSFGLRPPQQHFGRRAWLSSRSRQK